MMTAEIKMLNASWKPSWCSEGLSAKWRGPEIKAESWGRKNSPHLVHELANTVNTYYHRQSMSHRHSTKWVQSFQEGPQIEVLSQLSVIWSFYGGQLYCWVWVRTAQTQVTSTAEFPSSLVVRRGIQPPQSNSQSLFYISIVLLSYGAGQRTRKQCLSLFSLDHPPFSPAIHWRLSSLSPPCLRTDASCPKLILNGFC